jgi:hypothetical protein
VETLDYYDSISLGLIAGCFRAFGVGYNPNVSPAGLPADAWGGSGQFNFMDVAADVEFVSTSANDTAAGTGARTVAFNVLDENYVAKTIIVNTNGLTPVPVGNILASNGSRAILVGSNNSNVGDLILRDVSGGTIRGIILAGVGISRQASYTVPTGHSLLVKSIVLGVDSPNGIVGQFASVSTYSKAPGQSTIFALPIGNTSGQPYLHILGQPPILINEKNRWGIKIVRLSDNNSIITVGWNGILRSNK